MAGKVLLEAVEAQERTELARGSLGRADAGGLRRVPEELALGHEAPPPAVTIMVHLTLHAMVELE
jgi:hypothetical protein